MNDCLCQSAVACSDIWKHIHSACPACYDKGHVIIYIISKALKISACKNSNILLPLHVHPRSIPPFPKSWIQVKKYRNNQEGSWMLFSCQYQFLMSVSKTKETFWGWKWWKNCDASASGQSCLIESWWMAIICPCQQTNNRAIEIAALSNFQDLQRESINMFKPAVW